MHLLRALLLVVVLPAAHAAEPAPLLLISIDGFRWDYLEIHQAPHLERLAREGAQARSLIPVFPTKTFPNHYTIVTGLYPEHHGIVANTMKDPELGSFSLSNRRAVEDGRWWGGEPLWSTAEKQGVRAATCFWPGSEAEIGGIRPSYWRRYDKSFAAESRVELVLQWLDLPAEERPGLVTLYFSDVDTAGHEHGPESKETATAVAKVDQMIGRLLQGLEERGLRESMHLLVVSDHGMAVTPREQVVYLGDHVNLRGIEVSGGSPALLLRPPHGEEGDVLATLQKGHPRLHVLHLRDAPPEWHYLEHRRIPPLLAIVDEGWNLRTKRSGLPPPRGMHGYDPRLPSMHGILLGRGPGLARGARTEAVENVHLYALMCHLLGLEPAANDGNLEAVRGMLGSANREN